MYRIVKSMSLLKVIYSYNAIHNSKLNRSSCVSKQPVLFEIASLKCVCLNVNWQQTRARCLTTQCPSLKIPDTNFLINHPFIMDFENML